MLQFLVLPYHQQFILYCVNSKVFSLTLDNALIYKDRFFHLRCCTHILNLVVHVGLKDINEVVLKIRESVKHMSGSQLRKKKFLE